jgi:hypothetical protein
MTTTPLDDGSSITQRHARRDAVGEHVGRIGLGTVGMVTILVSAWGGLVAYVGPGFGYSADGAGSWHWSLSHSVLALIPGALGVLSGFVILGRVPGIVGGKGRITVAMAGFIALICGAWFVIGPLAWPVIRSGHGYFVAASPLRELENQVGYALGTGLILAACGAFVIGWASRHHGSPAASANEVAPMPTNVPPAATGDNVAEK